jgi:hypothetical protein
MKGWQVLQGNSLHGGIGNWTNYRIFQSGSLGTLWIWLCHLIENMPEIFRDFLIRMFISIVWLSNLLGDPIALPLSRISGMPSSFAGDSGMGGGSVCCGVIYPTDQ